MTTFSQLVDDLAVETRRVDLRADIARFLNQTIRELHFDSQTNSILFFADNFRELSLVAGMENGFGWDIPNPAIWQKLHAVQFLDVWDNGKQVWSVPTTPGRHLAGMSWYHYQMGGQFVFNGYGGIGGRIALGFYEYPQRLKYKQPDDRLVTWDDDLQVFEYDPSLTTDELKAEAFLRECNWLLTRWEDVLAEGIRAKVYKRVGDVERARTCYSLYMALRQGFWTSEIAQVQEAL